MDHSVRTFPETRVWKICFSSWKLRKFTCDNEDLQDTKGIKDNTRFIPTNS